VVLVLTHVSRLYRPTPLLALALAIHLRIVDQVTCGLSILSVTTLQTLLLDHQSNRKAMISMCSPAIGLTVHLVHLFPVQAFLLS
jgi:hypothetical protein